MSLSTQEPRLCCRAPPDFARLLFRKLLQSITSPFSNAIAAAEHTCLAFAGDKINCVQASSVSKGFSDVVVRVLLA